MFLDMPGFLLGLKYTKYDWVGLEYAWICLKYNVKETVTFI